MNTFTLSMKNYTATLPYIIALITLAVFCPVLWHEFVNLDDPNIVFVNDMVQSGISLDALQQAFTSFYASSWVPLTWISLMLDVQLFGSGPMGHHFINLLLHTGSSVLLFLIFNKATNAPLKSAAVSFLFALHPMHVQSVAWAAERKDVLSAFLGFSTIYTYLFYCEKKCAARYMAAFGLFVMGLLAKPMLVTFPVLLLLLDWWPLHRFQSAPEASYVFFKKNINLIVEKIPFFAVSAGTCVITYLAQKVTDGLVTEHPFSERFFRACISYGEYILKMFWPLKLSVFYPFVEAYPGFFRIGISLLFLLILSGAVLWFGRDFPYLVTGWLWYLVSLLPVIGLIQVGTHSIADHYSYISFTGLFVLLVWGGSQVACRWEFLRGILISVTAITLLAILVLTSVQVRYWKDTTTLLTHALEVTNGNWLALNNLGQEYLAKNRIDDAIWCFNEAIKIKPSFVLALVNLGALYAVKNEHVQARTLLMRALTYEPHNQKASFLLMLMSSQK